MEQPDVQKPAAKKPLLEIHPRELKFPFELKKQSKVTVYLTNVTDEYVAFKVKTTSPKKYCVRPNIGVVKPNSTFDFSVTMQAQKIPPSDMLCKDKFLIQGTIAPFGTTEEDIPSDMFAKESGKYIEECKLKVFLTSGLDSPSANGFSKQEQSSFSKIEPLTGLENHFAVSARNLFDVAKDSDFSTPTKVENAFAKLNSDAGVGSRLRDVEGTDKKFSRDIEELKSKLTTLDSELIQAKSNITRLTQEKSSAIQDNQKLKQELVMMRRNTGGRVIERGFPPLFVCMVALICLTVGYLLHG